MQVSPTLKKIAEALKSLKEKNFLPFLAKGEQKFSGRDLPA
jgi:hypothetical protein